MYVHTHTHAQNKQNNKPENIETAAPMVKFAHILSLIRFTRQTLGHSQAALSCGSSTDVEK